MQEETAIDTVDNEFQPPVSAVADGGLAVAASREAQSVLAMVMAAKRFPRDKFTALNRILKTCERFSVAEKAEYSFPRGGQSVRGPSIRLAEVIAQNWGNLDYGIVELDRSNGESIMEAYCWDLETNVRSKRQFTVAHTRDTKQGKKTLTDDRDIYEMTANQGSRRVRACILAVIPGDVSEKAVQQCHKTIAAGKGKQTKEERILGIVAAFDKIGVQQAAIEKRIGHEMSNCNDEEIADLVAIGNSIRDGVAKRSQYFDIADAQGEETQKLNEKYSSSAK